MLKRKAYDKLTSWKAKQRHGALCIIGARQIGKTTLVREFAKNNYENFIEINFITDKKSREIFGGALDANTLITNLTAYARKPMVPGKTLVLLDEIQKCPEARTAVKFLVEDGRFDYIESGSLLGVNFKEISSFPVGFEEIYRMYPMDFEEFLWANGVNDNVIDYLHKAFEDLTEVSESVHDIVNKLFYTYIVVGGMPEAVRIYTETHDIGQVISYQSNILEQYRLDIAQYADTSDKIKIKAIFDSIPSQLNDTNRRFYVNSLAPSARINRYDNSFKWLDDAGVALPCYNVELPQPPLKLNEKHSLFKLFMNDVGLLCAACMENIQFDILNGRLDLNLGSILENVMAQQIIANGFSLYYFDAKKYGELDFVIQNGLHIDLLEIKSGKNYKTHTSLNNVLKVKEWKFHNSYVFCKDNIQKENGIIYLPWYMIMFLKPSAIPEGTTYEVDLSTLM